MTFIDTSHDATQRSANLTRPKVMIGDRDVTEHVAAMYDALVGSMDWGSGFLDSDAIRGILIVGKLAGFDVPEMPECRDSSTLRFEVPYGTPGYHEAAKAFTEKQRIAVAAWRAQLQAEIDAAVAERDGDA